ncbi:MAG: ASKHA domain-containing protein [Actinomycetota bacterium]|nr:ASKHA domain-containing protein [Actinomycetota bacterium]
MKNKKKHLIKFIPGKKSIKVPHGYNLLKAIKDCGIGIESPCGGVGTCGRCLVRIKEGKVGTKKTRFISAEEEKSGYVLSCLSRVESDLVVETFLKSEVSAKIEKGIFTEIESKKYSDINRSEISSVKIKPWIEKAAITVQKPSLSYATSDLFRLKKSIRDNLGVKDCRVPIRLIKEIPDILRGKNWEVTVTVDKRHKTLIDIKAGRAVSKCYGLALDIGTTSLVLYLVDLKSGKIAASDSRYNPQIKFGEDIINRIVYAGKKGGLEKLRKAVIDSVDNMIKTLLSSRHLKEDKIVSMVVAGNSTMMHLFYGVSPKYIREEPYVTAANKFPDSNAREIGLKYIKNARIYNVAGVASYLGGDITSGILATKLHKEKELSLFLDLGTNGELVVGNSEWMIGASCSAGPAFEGGGVKCGMRAVDGAIEKVAIDRDSYKCSIEVIGGERPAGICGSGLIDVIGEMYLKGVIDRKGKFNKDTGNKYLKRDGDIYRYILVDGENSADGKDIYITEVDIDNLIRAKAAVYAGIKTLLEEVGLGIGDIKKIYIAGGLGKHIYIKNAIAIGMLPDIEPEKYFFLGNTSVTGAYLSLLSENKYRQSLKISEKITYVELSASMNFMDRYVAGLFLPYTDMKDFPSVEKGPDTEGKKSKRGS